MTDFWGATEAERQVGEEVERLLDSLRGRDRELRRFACAVCREMWPYLRDERSRQAVEVAERFAEGRATEEELSEARTQAAILASSAYPACRANAALAATLDDAHEAALTAHRVRIAAERETVAMAARLRFRDVPPGRPDLVEWLSSAIERDCVRATAMVAARHRKYLADLESTATRAVS